MSCKWIALYLLVVIVPLAGCQHKRLSQAHVHEVWEYGDPIENNFLYYKGGAWVFRYDQITLFDQNRYECRATTMVAQGTLQDWDTRTITGTWKRDEDGHPMLRQKDGSYRRLDAIYPGPDPALDPLVMQPGGPAIHNRLRRTYAVQWPKPMCVQEIILPDGPLPIDEE